MNQALLGGLIEAYQKLKQEYRVAIEADRRDIAREISEAIYRVNDAMSLLVSGPRREVHS